jgi:hypothetical protein
VKSKVKTGFLKELKSPASQGQSEKKAFDYSKPVSKVERVQNMAVNSRAREHRSVKQDTSTNFAVEQRSAKDSHKGSK